MHWWCKRNQKYYNVIKITHKHKKWRENNVSFRHQWHKHQRFILDHLMVLFVCRWYRLPIITHPHLIPIIAHQTSSMIIGCPLKPCCCCVTLKTMKAHVSPSQGRWKYYHLQKNEEVYLNVIIGNTEIDDTILNTYQKHYICQKCQLLCITLHVALKKWMVGAGKCAAIWQ